MSNLPTGDLMGLNVHLLSNKQFVSQIANFVNEGKTAQVVTLNPEMSEMAAKDESFKNLIKQADLVTPDGISVVWALKKLGYRLQERVTGIDLLHSLCKTGSTSGWRFFLLGAAPGIADKAAENLMNMYPGLQIVGTHNGFFSAEEETQLLKNIIVLKPDILFVALGAPRQEFWLQKNLPQFSPCVGIGVGGSFDVVSGLKKRAPNWVIKLNLEWLYRLLSEPSRLKRQLVIPRFMLRVNQAARKKHRKNKTVF